MNMKMKKITLSITAAVGILATPTLWAQMTKDGMNMNGADQPKMSAPQAPGLPESAKTVFDNYFKIQTALATNSLQGVSGCAASIERAVRFDAGQTFSSGEVGSAARDLAGASNLPAARQVFKRLSGALIKFADGHPEYAGRFVRVYCPMANAMWLQDNSVVNNPYLGGAEARCGQIQN